MSWKDCLKEGSELVLISSSKKAEPHGIIVISLGIIDNKILIGLCQSNTSIKNFEDNKSACIIVKNKKEYYRIKGKTELFSSGEYFDIAIEKSKGYDVKKALLVNIDEVFDLENVKKIL